MNLPFPRKVLDQHIAVLGKTGSGKSSVMRAIVEWLLAANEPVCIIDPKGDWWGVKSSADGKHAGFPVVIFGGEHADVPINEHAGASIAELVATGNRPSLIDLSQLMVGERTHFFVRFAEAIFRHTRGMRWLVVDEVHNFAPQGKVLDPEAGKMLHWANRLASEGRGKGIQLLAASQRSQKVHKDFLDSCETLIAMRSVNPRSRKAVQEWIEGCADPAKAPEILQSLAQMPRGTGWVWSPEIGFGPVKIEFPAFRTFDSFKPRLSHARLKGWAAVDLNEVKTKLAAVVKEAQANDPRLLRIEIMELKNKLAKPQEQAQTGPRREDLAVIAALRKALESAMKLLVEINARGFFDAAGEKVDKKQIEKAIEGAADAVKTLVERRLEHRNKEFARLKLMSARVIDDLSALLERDVTVKVDVRHNQPFTVSAPMQRQTVIADPGSIEKPMPRAFLTALAQHPNGLTKGQILTHTGYRSSGSTSACFAELAANGWTSVTGGFVRISEAGLKALGTYEPLPTGDALRAHLLNGSKLGPMEKAMMRVLFDSYPSVCPKGRILETAGYKSSGSTSAAFARLVTLGYATKASGGLAAARELYA